MELGRRMCRRIGGRAGRWTDANGRAWMDGLEGLEPTRKGTHGYARGKEKGGRAHGWINAGGRMDGGWTRTWVVGHAWAGTKQVNIGRRVGAGSGIHRK